MYHHRSKLSNLSKKAILSCLFIFSLLAGCGKVGLSTSDAHLSLDEHAALLSQNLAGNTLFSTSTQANVTPASISPLSTSSLKAASIISDPQTFDGIPYAGYMEYTVTDQTKNYTSVKQYYPNTNSTADGSPSMRFFYNGTTLVSAEHFAGSGQEAGQVYTDYYINNNTIGAKRTVFTIQTPNTSFVAGFNPEGRSLFETYANSTSTKQSTQVFFPTKSTYKSCLKLDIDSTDYPNIRYQNITVDVLRGGQVVTYAGKNFEISDSMFKFDMFEVIDGQETSRKIAQFKTLAPQGNQALVITIYMYDQNGNLSSTPL